MFIVFAQKTKIVRNSNYFSRVFVHLFQYAPVISNATVILTGYFRIFDPFAIFNLSKKAKQPDPLSHFPSQVRARCENAVVDTQRISIPSEQN